LVALGGAVLFEVAYSAPVSSSIAKACPA